jgi:RNA polymerase sigma-70 factor (ECF subfamily)
MKVDSELLDAARSMNAAAIAEIFEHYASALFEYARRLCNDPVMADNIVGDVFAKLWETLSVGKGPETNLRSYLYEMTYHLVVDAARYSCHTAPMEAADFRPQDASATEVGGENHVLFDAILRSIQNHLTTQQRHVIILRFLEGFSLKETAAILGKEVGCVKVTQGRAIGALRKVLDWQVKD